MRTAMVRLQWLLGAALLAIVAIVSAEAGSVKSVQPCKTTMSVEGICPRAQWAGLQILDRIRWEDDPVAEDAKEEVSGVGETLHISADSVDTVTGSVSPHATAQTSSPTGHYLNDAFAEGCGSAVVVGESKGGGIYGDGEVSDSTIRNPHTTHSTSHSSHLSADDSAARRYGSIAVQVEEGTTRDSDEIEDGVEARVQRAMRGDAAGANDGEDGEDVSEGEPLRVAEKVFQPTMGMVRQWFAGEVESLDHKAVNLGAGAVHAGKDRFLVVWRGFEDHLRSFATAVHHALPDAAGAMMLYKRNDDVMTTSATFNMRHAAEAIEPTALKTEYDEGNMGGVRSAEGTTEVCVHEAVRHMLHADLYALMPTTWNHGYDLPTDTLAVTDARVDRIMDPASSLAQQGTVRVAWKWVMVIVDGALDVTTWVEPAVRGGIGAAVHTDSGRGVLMVEFTESWSSAVKHEDKVDGPISRTLILAVDLSSTAHIQSSDLSAITLPPVVASKQSGDAFALGITAAADIGLPYKEGLLQVRRDNSRGVARIAEPLSLIQTSSAYESTSVHVPVKAKPAMRSVVKLTILQGHDLSMPGSAFTLQIAYGVHRGTGTYCFVAVHPAVYGSASVVHSLTLVWGLSWRLGCPGESVVIHYVSMFQTTADSRTTRQAPSSSASAITLGIANRTASWALVVVGKVASGVAMDVVLVVDVHGHGALLVATGYHKASPHVETQDAVALSWTAARLPSSLTTIVGEAVGVRGVDILDIVAALLFDSSTGPTPSNVGLDSISVHNSPAAAVVMVRHVELDMEGQVGTALAPPAQSLVLFYIGGGCSPTAASWSSSIVAAHSTHSTQTRWDGHMAMVASPPSLVQSTAVDTWTAFTEKAGPSVQILGLAASNGHVMAVLGVALLRVEYWVHVGNSVVLCAEGEVVSARMTRQPRIDGTAAVRTLNRIAAPQTLPAEYHTLPAEGQAGSTSGPRVHGGGTVAVAAAACGGGGERVDDNAVDASSMTNGAEAAPADAHAEAGTAFDTADVDRGLTVDVDVSGSMELLVSALKGAWRPGNASLSGVGAGVRERDSGAPRARTLGPLTPTAASNEHDLTDSRPFPPTPRPINPRGSPPTSLAEEGPGDVRVLETREQVPNMSLGLPPSLPVAAGPAHASAAHGGDTVAILAAGLSAGGGEGVDDEDVAIDWLAYEYRVKRTVHKEGFMRVAGAALRTGDVAAIWIIVTILWAYVSWLVVLILAAALCWHWQTSADRRRTMTEAEARHRSAIGAYYAAFMSRKEEASALEKQMGDLTGQLAALQRNLKLSYIFGSWEAVAYLLPLIRCLADPEKEKETDVSDRRRYEYEYFRAMDGFLNAYKRLWAFTAPLEANDTLIAAERAHHRELEQWVLDETISDIAKWPEAFKRLSERVENTLDDLHAPPLNQDEITFTPSYEDQRRILVWGDYWGELKKTKQSSGLASVLESPPPPKSPPASPTCTTNCRANASADNLPRPFQSPRGSPASSINSRSTSPGDNLPRPFSMRV